MNPYEDHRGGATVSGFSHSTSFDAERAVNQLDQERQALVKMTGAESLRIDGLVKNVGDIKGEVGALGGDVRAVREKVDGVADGVNELRDALTVLVRHDVQMQHNATEAAALRKETADIRADVQILKQQVGPLVETRKGLIVLAGAVATTILLAVLGLVLKT